MADEADEALQRYLARKKDTPSVDQIANEALARYQERTKKPSSTASKVIRSVAAANLRQIPFASGLAEKVVSPQEDIFYTGKGAYTGYTPDKPSTLQLIGESLPSLKDIGKKTAEMAVSALPIAAEVAASEAVAGITGLSGLAQKISSTPGGKAILKELASGTVFSGSQAAEPLSKGRYGEAATSFLTNLLPFAVPGAFKYKGVNRTAAQSAEEAARLSRLEGYKQKGLQNLQIAKTVNEALNRPAPSLSKPLDTIPKPSIDVPFEPQTREVQGRLKTTGEVTVQRLRERGMVPPDPVTALEKAKNDAIDSTIRAQSEHISPPPTQKIWHSDLETVSLDSLKKTSSMLMDGEKDPVGGLKNLDEFSGDNGVDPALLEKPIEDSAKEFQKGFSRGAGSAALKLTDEKYVPRVGEMVIDGAKSEDGAVSIVRGPGDAGTFGRVIYSGATMSMERPETTGLLRTLDAAFKDVRSAGINIDKQFKDLGKRRTPLEREALGRVLQEEDEFGKRLTEGELQKKGIIGDLRKDYEFIRDKIHQEGETERVEGRAVRDTHTHYPHVWEGDLQILDASRKFEKSGEHPTVDFAIGNEDAISKVTKLLKDNPNGKYIVKQRIDIPDSIYAMDPKGMQEYSKALSKGYRDQAVDAARLENMKRTRGGRFFGPLEPRIANLGTYVKDPYVAMRMYLRGLYRKRILDQADRSYLEFIKKADPADKNFLEWLRNYRDDNYGRSGPVDNFVRSFFDGVFTKIGGKELAQKPWLNPDKFLKKIYQYELVSKIWYNVAGPMKHFMMTSLNTMAIAKSPIDFAKAMGMMERVSLGKAPEEILDVLRDLRANTMVFTPQHYDWAVQQSKLGVLDPFWPYRTFMGRSNPTAALTGYFEGKRMGLKGSELMNHAWQFMNRASADVSPAAMTPIARSRVFTALRPFQHWIAKELEFLYSMDKKELGKLATAGVVLTGLSPYPKWAPGYRSVLKQKIENPKASRGLLGLVGLGSWAEHMFSFFNPDQSIYQGGAIWEDAKKMYDAVANGNYAPALRTSAPYPLRKAMDMYEMAKTGKATSPVTGEYISPVSLPETALSFLATPPSAMQAEDVRELVAMDIAEKRKTPSARTIRQKQTMTRAERAYRRSPKDRRTEYRELLNRAGIR